MSYTLTFIVQKSGKVCCSAEYFQLICLDEEPECEVLKNLVEYLDSQTSKDVAEKAYLFTALAHTVLLAETPFEILLRSQPVPSLNERGTLRITFANLSHRKQPL